MRMLSNTLKVTARTADPHIIYCRQNDIAPYCHSTVHFGEGNEIIRFPSPDFSPHRSPGKLIGWIAKHISSRRFELLAWLYILSTASKVGKTTSLSFGPLLRNCRIDALNSNYQQYNTFPD